MVKDADNIYYCNKNQVVCRGRYGHFTMEQTNNKMAISPRTHNPRTLILGTVIYIVSIFYHAKNQVGGLCVGKISIQTGNLPHTLLKP